MLFIHPPPPPPYSVIKAETDARRKVDALLDRVILSTTEDTPAEDAEFGPRYVYLKEEDELELEDASRRSESLDGSCFAVPVRKS